MTSRQRFLTALSCQEPDRVPVWEMYVNGASIVNVARLLWPEHVQVDQRQNLTGQEGEEVTDLYCDIIEELDMDGACFGVGQGLVGEGDNTARDKFGTLHELSDLGEPYPLEGPIRELSDLRGFDMASRLDEDDFAQIVQVMRRLGPDRAHVVSMPEPFKISWRLRGGMEQLLIDYATDPDMVHGLSRVGTDYCLAIVEMSARLGADTVVLPGDLAGEQTLIMSPKHYRDYVKPYQAEIVAHAHKYGLKAIKHSDGNMWPILDDLVEIGFDGFHPVQPQCMDMAEVKHHLAGRCCVLGNIDCRELLVYGTGEQVEQTVRDTIAVAAPGGGYVLVSSNSIHPSVKPENFIAMVRAAHKYGKYN